MTRHAILFLNSMKFMGGGETWMLATAALLVKNGHRVVLVARRGSPIEAGANELGLDVRALHMGGDMNPILLWKLARIMRECGIDTAVSNTARDVRIAAFARFAARRAIRIVGLQQVDKAISNRWNYRLTFNHFADAIVVNSAATKRTIVEGNTWIDGRRITVVPHGIDPARYQPRRPNLLREELSLRPDAVVIGFVGRLSGQKGISVLLAAMEKIAVSHPNAHLVIAGIGTLADKVERFIETSGLRGRVHPLGFRDDVPSLMGAFDLLLVPSLWEGFGLVLIEAMAAGTPCIASDVSSIPEIVDDGVNGLLVPPGDPAALAAATDQLISDPLLREQLGAAAQTKVLNVFTRERMIAGYEKLFDSLAADRKSAAA